MLTLLLCWSCLPPVAHAGRELLLDERFYREISAKPLGELRSNFEFDVNKYQQVTRQFGPTVLDLSKLPYASPVLDSGKRPWSSWWFQKLRHEFAGDPRSSILAKYDRVFKLSGSALSAYKEETILERDPYAPWEGLCDAWALASLFYPEPRKPVTIAGEKFSIVELKGLVLKTFEAVPDSDLIPYGEKFLGNSEAWMYPDVFPEQLHRFIEVVLGQNKQAFVMDRDAGIEVWTVPVYKANFKMERHPSDPKSVVVKMWLYTGGPYSYDRRQEVGSEEIVFQYLYELSGELSSDQKTLTVTSGTWLKSGLIDSRSNHPDYLLLPKLNTLNRASYNRYVDPAKVDSIVKGSL